MKIGTWNVNGIRARQSQFIEWVERDQPDIVCLQEIKASPLQVPPLCDLGTYWCYWHGLGGYSGVGLHFRKDAFPEKPLFAHPEFDYENRIVTAQVPACLIASIYVPNGGKDFPAKMHFLDSLERFVAAKHAAGLPLILCGDLNVARSDMDVHPKERKATLIGQLPEERELFEKILSHGMVDIGRALNPNNDQMFTWWPPWRNMRQRNIGWRIDYVLVSRSLAENILEFKVLTDFGTSDHAPILITLKEGALTR